MTSTGTPHDRDRAVGPMFDVVDRIAGYGWDSSQIRRHLLELSSAMSAELELIAAGYPAGERGLRARGVPLGAQPRVRLKRRAKELVGAVGTHPGQASRLRAACSGTDIRSKPATARVSSASAARVSPAAARARPSARSQVGVSTAR